MLFITVSLLFLLLLFFLAVLVFFVSHTPTADVVVEAEVGCCLVCLLLLEVDRLCLSALSLLFFCLLGVVVEALVDRLDFSALSFFFAFFPPALSAISTGATATSLPGSVFNSRFLLRRGELAEEDMDEENDLASSNGWW